MTHDDRLLIASIALLTLATLGLVSGCQIENETTRTYIRHGYIPGPSGWTKIVIP